MQQEKDKKKYREGHEQDRVVGISRHNRHMPTAQWE